MDTNIFSAIDSVSQWKHGRSCGEAGVYIYPMGVAVGVVVLVVQRLVLTGLSWLWTLSLQTAD